MSSKILVSIVCSTMTMFATEHMSIAVCNLGGVPERTVAGAKSVVGAIFSPLGVEVDWKRCEDSGSALNIVLRLLRKGPAGEPRGDSLQAMGMAFTRAGVAGSRADVYFGAIDELASLRQADPAEVLGYVVAHELGHLLGLGHFAGGIMSASWNDKMLKAARKRWLKFNESQCAAIHRALQKRTLLAGWG